MGSELGTAWSEGCGPIYWANELNEIAYELSRNPGGLLKNAYRSSDIEISTIFLNKQRK